MTDVEMAEEEIICESEQKSQRSPCKWIIVTTIFLIACGLFSALSIYNHLNINRLENDIIQAESRQDSFQIQELTAAKVEKLGYHPQGPQSNVALATVLAGGWKHCYEGDYSTSLDDSNVRQIASVNCTQENIMVACRKRNSPATLKVLAWANRNVVFRENNTRGIVSKGTRWYWTPTVEGTTGVPREDSRSARGSIGFLDAELAMPELNPCDASNSDQESRLCWHTYGQGGGYRCGADSGTSQNWEKGWERLIFQSDRTA